MKERVLSLITAIAVMLCAFAASGAAYAADGEQVWSSYSAMGTHKTSFLTFKKGDYKYRVLYPSDIGNMGKCPVLLFCNPTSYSFEATPAYFEFLNYAVSRGYVVLINNDKIPGDGKSMDAGFTKLIKKSKNENSVLYNKLDLNRVVTAGHSQGGNCAVNLADKNKYENAKYIKAIFTASLMAPDKSSDILIKTSYDYTSIRVPILMIAGNGFLDEKLICPLESGLQLVQKGWKSDAYIARITGADHVDSMHRSFPYMLAWFDYQLYGNELAAKAFKGASPELLNKSGWQDASVKIARKSRVKGVKAVKNGFTAAAVNEIAADGWQVCYSPSKDIKTAAVVELGSSSSYTARGLKSGKTYYVRFRSYTLINSTPCYSKWSKAVKVKIK